MPTLGIFVKQPIVGQVKTRLGRTIGMQQSAAVYTAFQKDILEACETINCQRVIAYAPANDMAEDYFSAQYSEKYQLWPQPNTSLGERMQAFFAEHLQDGPVVIIGSDSPSLPMMLIEQAFQQLSESDVVLGPAVDGGYYLVGQRRYVPEMFEQIDWSQPTVLSQTIERLKKTEATLSLLSPWYDVDSLHDLQMLYGHLHAMKLTQHTQHLPLQTYKLVEEYFASNFSDT